MISEKDYYKTACVKVILNGERPSNKMKVAVGIDSGDFGYYSQDRFTISGIDNAINYEDNGVFSDLQKEV